MLGRIMKGIGGFYYVYVDGKGIVSCRARGALREQKIKPLVGDWVEISEEVAKDAEFTAALDEIKPRSSELVRPAVSNVDQALIVMAAANPAPSLILLDRLLVFMSRRDLPVIIAINKCELETDLDYENIRAAYEAAGAKVFFTSVKNGIGLDELKAALKGRTTALCGSSGVGKSSLTKALFGIETVAGDISEKLGRGKHTTRHSELFFVGDDTYIMDTPGFGSLELEHDLVKTDIAGFYREFLPYLGQCRFRDCRHDKDAGCAIRMAVQNGELDEGRVLRYTQLLTEVPDEIIGKKYR